MRRLLAGPVAAGSASEAVLGAEVRVRLDAVHPAERAVEFTLVG